jgi:hypothetical protein
MKSVHKLGNKGVGDTYVRKASKYATKYRAFSMNSDFYQL